MASGNCLSLFCGNVIQSTALSEGGMSTFDKVSMSNIPAASHFLWIHTFVVILTTLFGGHM